MLDRMMVKLTTTGQEILTLYNLHTKVGNTEAKRHLLYVSQLFITLNVTLNYMRVYAFDSV